MISRKNIVKYLLPLFILLLTFTSVGGRANLPVNTFLIWLIDFSCIACVLWYKTNFFEAENKKDYLIVKLYFLWMILGVLRGFFVADNYWEWKQLISGTSSLILPLFVYVFSLPWLLSNVLHIWLKYAVPLFFLFFMWALNSSSYHFYLGPVLLLSCFLPAIPFKKWKLIFIFFLFVMISSDLGARSQVIKSSMSVIIALAYMFSKYYSHRILKFMFWLFIICPIGLLYLGISGEFNIFRDLASNKGKYVETRVVDGELKQEDLSSDTRTFIYVEVIESALKHNYVLMGRTPARGNDSISFGKDIAEDLGTDKFERHKNEVVFTNIFTWLGIVGMVLYCFIYIKSAYLAVYKSNNLYLKLIGVFIAFRFAYGWVEDINDFNILSVSLWMMIAMGFSVSFRKMNNQEFKYWLYGIFKMPKSNYT